MEASCTTVHVCDLKLNGLFVSGGKNENTLGAVVGVVGWQGMQGMQEMLEAAGCV